MDTHLRSILKASTYRATGTIVTFGIALLLLGKIDLAVKIGTLDTLFKILVYYAHERMWEKVNIGKRKPPEYQI